MDGPNPNPWMEKTSRYNNLPINQPLISMLALLHSMNAISPFYLRPFELNVYC